MAFATANPNGFYDGATIYRSIPIGQDGKFRITGLREGVYRVGAHGVDAKWNQPLASIQEVHIASGKASPVSLVRIP